ncbi:lipoprotein-releasing ABC transporter ATP-binding protein LolD [Aliidiomarina quisquiliarum]|uniref:lipoprotein-releasing ABC transporter ATP-binding protein LolD n=1 Tax=Aliidiomarina quisquiliarum TaxID=2938947 RepID=UPI00208DFA04|nr:lipoprotein-releasing ABC transporter ATP-binding protein LolD [Aliidiomarina quisquiliarum]MCO4320404.1 lipoprotein-releasing ABC transporter ATP-binding protein LolD [Aliidiomarina quisquiliarum]
MNSLVKVSNLCRSFGDGEDNALPDATTTPRAGSKALVQEQARRLQVLDQVSLKVNKGDMVAIIGASGSGKSTLLHCLGGLDTPDTGDIQVAGENVVTMTANQKAKWRNQSIGFIYQFHHLLAEFTALENVAMPLLIGGVSKAKAEAHAKNLLGRVGLSARATHLPSQLSGGERQRVAIARALANKPKLVLADEPTGNLDEETATLIYELMLELNQELGTAFIVVTHDHALAAKLPRQLTMQQGKLVEGRV